MIVWSFTTLFVSSLTPLPFCWLVSNVRRPHAPRYVSLSADCLVASSCNGEQHELNSMSHEPL